MTDLRALYQEVVIDHGRHPRNFGQLDACTHEKQGFNPLCGDKLALYLKVKDNVVESVKFEGVGCAISMASASLMTQLIQGKKVEDVLQLFDEFHDLILHDGDGVHLDKCQILAGVKQYPARVKCATLAWHTLKAAILNDDQAITTE